jgi:hypothetical protein
MIYILYSISTHAKLVDSFEFPCDMDFLWAIHYKTPLFGMLMCQIFSYSVERDLTSNLPHPWGPTHVFVTGFSRIGTVEVLKKAPTVSNLQSCVQQISWEMHDSKLLIIVIMHVNMFMYIVLSLYWSQFFCLPCFLF